MAERQQGVVDFSIHGNPPDLDKGAGFAKRAVWHLVNAIFLQSPLNPSSKIKSLLLRLFGAKIGKSPLLKPGISIKSPWFLEIGDYCLMGENVWIDSLAKVTIGNSVCLSQGAYLCCGNHDWTDPAFTKFVRPIVIENGAWIATKATVMGGVRVKSHAIVAAGSVLSMDAEPYTIYRGVPAVPVKKRIVRQSKA